MTQRVSALAPHSTTPGDLQKPEQPLVLLAALLLRQVKRFRKATACRHLRPYESPFVQSFETRFRHVDILHGLQTEII